MKLSLNMVSKHAFWYPYLPDYRTQDLLAAWVAKNDALVRVYVT